MGAAILHAEPSEANPLGTQPIGKLLLKFAIPTITSSLVTAAYNITDQIFIGHGVGYLGNAATNIAFPLSTLCLAVSIMLGQGSASHFNLSLGAGHKEEAAEVAGTGISLSAIFGLLIGLLAFFFTEPLMRVFGATAQIFPYAVTYTHIIALGLPFLVFSSACSNLIRSDGSPNYSLLCVAAGTILNIILNPIFIFVFHWGVAGSAYATVISQVVSFILTVAYLWHFKSIAFHRRLLLLQANCIIAIAKLGVPGFLNQFMMMIVQITMNLTLNAFGATSIYGSDIPLAVVGVISKLNVILVAFTVGIALGAQPIFGFNYGAKNYARVKATYKLAAVVVLISSTIFFLCFQLFPRQIVSIFGSGSEAYFAFAERYMRIYMMLVFLFGLQPLTANFFTSIGKAYKGLFITMTRQGLFLLPLLLLLPRFFGLDGAMYAGPVSDTAAALLAIFFAARELAHITRLEQGLQAAG